MSPADVIAANQGAPEASLGSIGDVGTDAPPINLVRDANLTFAQLAARYVDEFSRANRKTWRIADTYVRTHALPVWGDRRVSELTAQDVERLLQRIAQQRSPTLVSSVRAALRVMFAWAVQRGVGGIAANLVPSRRSRYK